MRQLARALVGVASDVLRLVVSSLRPSGAIRAENMVLRKQLARYIERGIRPRRVDHATRVSLALFTRLFDWRDAVVNVRPATIVRSHRLGWRIYWRRKCRAGRAPIPPTATAPDSQDGHRESALGRGEDCQRATGQARNPGLAENGRPIGGGCARTREIGPGRHATCAFHCDGERKRVTAMGAGRKQRRRDYLRRTAPASR